MRAPTDSTGLVLIGTAQTVSSATRQLREAGVSILGAIVLTRQDAAVPQAVPVLGTLDDLERIHSNYPFTTALVTLPAAMGAAIARVRAHLKALRVAERFLPTLQDVLSHEPSSVWRGIGEIDMLGLIGRAPRAMDKALVSGLLAGRRVLITGAGGSIGSELARICASMEPAQIVLMERSDNALFEIDRQIGAMYPGVKRHAVLHDVVDADATLRRLVSLRPDVVFHAAAHKHVPLMEDHPAAAVNNNLFGTKSVADAALAVGADRFVLISTDKAVNPTSVMGATKRLAELYVRSLNDPATPGVTGRTKFSLVRFGNVLGSACSVLPIWTRQIAEGGPVTVTHPEMTRYFMTIPEAAALVIQAAALPGSTGQGTGSGSRHGGGGGVFVLDMGQPVRILDLALNFCRAHGLTPRIDSGSAGGAALPALTPAAGGQGSPEIRLSFTGVRPGEKLYEELAYDAEELLKTAVDGVCGWDGDTIDRVGIAAMIEEMAGVRHAHDRASVMTALHRHVPELDQTKSNNHANPPFQVVQPSAA